MSVTAQGLDGLVAAMATAGDREAVWDALRDHARGRGFAAMLYYPGPPVPPLSPRLRLPVTVHADGFPDPWLAELRVGGSAADIMLRRAARTPLLVRWTELAGRYAEEGSPEAADHARALMAHGGGDGVLVPLYGPGLRAGYLLAGFGGADCPVPDDGLRALHCAAQYAHLVYAGMAARDGAEGPLSPREREVLGWIARGKSNAAIAAIMKVSYHTVDTMVRRIFAKLNAADRTTAAVRGLAAGLIDLPEVLA